MSDITFAERVVVVTGAGRGLGRAYAVELARRGARVIVNDVAEDAAGVSRADLTVEEIEQAGGIAVASTASVASRQGGTEICDLALSRFGRVDAVINNAGFSSTVPFESVSTEEMLRLYEVHVLGAIYVTQPIYRVMLERGYGRIVLTSSGGGLFGRPGAVAYATAKAALLG
jgi:NAD(P)-dependent dehydrogenase (short-subunit alcohol dehydrogenase family)